MADRNGGSEKSEKRQTILEEAIRTFAELGFRGTDVQMIADRAGVGKGTVYRCFNSKEDLFWATTFEVMKRLDAAVFGAMKDVEGAAAKLYAASIAYARFFETNPQYLEVFVQDRAEFRGAAPESHREHHQKMIREVEKVIQQGIETGELLLIEPRNITLALASLLYGIVVLGCHLAPLSGVEMTKHALGIFLRGMRASLPNEETQPFCSVESHKP